MCFRSPRYCVDEMIFLAEMGGLLYKLNGDLSTFLSDGVGNHPPCVYRMLLVVGDVNHREYQAGFRLDDAHWTAPYSLELLFPLRFRAYHYIVTYAHCYRG